MKIPPGQHAGLRYQKQQRDVAVKSPAKKVNMFKDKPQMQQVTFLLRTVQNMSESIKTISVTPIACCTSKKVLCRTMCIYLHNTYIVVRCDNTGLLVSSAVV